MQLMNVLPAYQMSKQMYNNMCRTCMLYNADQTCIQMELDYKEESNKLELISIDNVPEEMKKQKLSLIELLKATVPQLKFEEKDKLPKKVCHSCSKKIINFYNFQLICLKNEEKLYKLLELDQDNELLRPERYLENKFITTERLKNCLNQNNLLEYVETEKETKNVYCSEDDSNMSDISSQQITNHSNCKSHDIKKEKTAKKKAKRSVKKKFNKNSSSKQSTRPKELFSCDKCQRKLKSELSLMKHQELHFKRDTEEKELKCSTCNKVFPEIAIFKEHQRTHTCEKTFLCSECGKGFASAGSLKQHSFRHLEKKLYSCPDCPKSFPTNGDLICHYETHKAKPRIHVCDKCGRGFYKPFLLKQHQRYHNDERPFPCEFCEKRFVTSEKQRRHMRTHTGEKPYPCKYCDRAFAQSGDCIKHLRQHLGDNVYQCELCPLRFPLAKNLRAHFATHKDDDDETRSRNLKARKEEERNLQMKFSNQDL